MIDPITNQHGTRNEPNTYKRGSQRIYYILCSNGLTPFIKPCGLLPFDFIKTSDHRGLYIDIDLDPILKDPLHQFINNKCRLLRTNNRKYVTKDKIHIMKYIQQHGPFNRRYII